MPDPLSVAASLGGLIASAAAMTASCYEIGTSLRDAPQVTNEVASELDNITVVLQQLFAYVSGKAKAAIERLNLITVEQITATLTDCVVTYSHLDGVLKSLRVDGDMTAWDRGMWYVKKGRIIEIVQRLQNHKASLGLMLNILQCASLTVAESSMDRLCDVVNEVLRTNQDLSLRLRNIEQRQNSQSIDGGRDATLEVPEPPAQAQEGARLISAAEELVVETETVQPSLDSINESPTDQPRDLNRMIGSRRVTSHFEELLHQSRVYRRYQASNSGSNTSYSDSMPSLISDARNTLALSISSSLSLGDITSISVYALPVYADELSNASCYDFGTIASVEDPVQVTVGGSTGTTQTAPGLKQLRWRLSRSRTTSDIVPTAESVVSTTEEYRGLGAPLLRSARVAVEDVRPYINENIPVVAKSAVYLKKNASDVKEAWTRTGAPKLTKAARVIKAARDAYETTDRPPTYDGV